MQETERSKPGDDFRQGDIIRLEDELHQEPPSELGVIINADCDLIHGKLDGVIAYLPMYPFQTYLARFWAPNYIDELRRVHLDRVRDICGLNDKEAEDLLRWLPTSSPQHVCSRLANTSALTRKNTSEIAKRLETLAYFTNSDNEPLASFSWYCHRDSNPAKFARKQITQAYSGMGSGHFFISEFIGESGIGYVVRMRRIYTIDIACCFPSQSSRLSSTASDRLTAVRVARLSTPFRFKLAQLFAYQFSRIGLPDDVTALSELAIDNVLQQLMEKST